MIKKGNTGLRIGVDIGGTFTDMVLVSEGRIEVVKVPSVPSDPAAGVVEALHKAAKVFRRSTKELLQACELFVHGSTVATNLLLEEKGARVGLVTSEGFRDVLEIRRGLRDSPWAHRTPYAPVLVPRYLRRTVGGRIERDGRISKTLSMDDVQAAAEVFRQHDVSSVAVCLYNGYLNPEGEQAIGAELERHGVAVPISISTDNIASLAGEYERCSTAVMNAYIGPKTTSYLAKLSEALKSMGLRQSLMLVQSNGGTISVDEISKRPVTLLLSGPASGVGALRYYENAIGSDNLISMEIGGTSCDVVLVNQGKVEITDNLQIGGYRVTVPSVDVHTIGAGGGTIARVNVAGMLEIGPQGAGARPGPACFGFGGEDPTITDAQVVLGRLKGGAYAGGALTIQPELAERAIRTKVGAALGISSEEAAVGIIRLMEQKLLGAVQKLSIERGYDPERFTLVACGGAGPMHGADVARQLGCKQAYVPRASGAFCALGMLNTNARHDFVRTFVSSLDNIDDVALNTLFDELASTAKDTLLREGFSSEEISLERSLSLQYPGQQSDIQVPIAHEGERLDTANIRSAFEQMHEQFYGHIQPNGELLVTKARLIGVGHLPTLLAQRHVFSEAKSAPRESRRVWMDQVHGWCEVPVYEGPLLDFGAQIRGPAIIEEATTTILVGVNDLLLVDADNNYLITLSSESEQP